MLFLKPNSIVILLFPLQLGSPEEQEAVVRRELQARKKVLQDKVGTEHTSSVGCRVIQV